MFSDAIIGLLVHTNMGKDIKILSLHALEVKLWLKYQNREKNGSHFGFQDGGQIWNIFDATIGLLVHSNMGIATKILSLSVSEVKLKPKI